MADVFWFCPHLDCDMYGQHNVQDVTGSFGVKPEDGCQLCGADLEWRPA